MVTRTVVGASATRGVGVLINGGGVRRYVCGWVVVGASQSNSYVIRAVGSSEKNQRKHRCLRAKERLGCAPRMPSPGESRLAMAGRIPASSLETMFRA